MAEKRFASLSHENLVHKPIPKLQAMKIPGRKSRSGQRVGEPQNFASMARDEGQEQKEVFEQARTEWETDADGLGHL